MPQEQSMKAETAAKKLGVLLSATPEDFRSGPGTRSELNALQETPPEWLGELRRPGPPPRPPGPPSAPRPRREAGRPDRRPRPRGGDGAADDRRDPAAARGAAGVARP